MTRLAFLAPILALACASPADPSGGDGALPLGAQAFSLLGEPLFPPALPDEELAARQEELDVALATSYADTAEGMIWIGRRLAYLGYFEDAVVLYVAGTRAYPDDMRFPRHLGHRWITLRRFADAERELAYAAERVADQPDQVEPDGQPNASGIPLTTLKTNIYYHLGLARYLQGDFEGAIEAYEAYHELNDDDDGTVAITHWYVMALRRLGRFDEAQVQVALTSPDMTILENTAYHRMCMIYAGELDAEVAWTEALANGSGVDVATLGYGIGNWYYTEGKQDEALELWKTVVAGEDWHAFGHIAAEAELARL